MDPGPDRKSRARDRDEIRPGDIVHFRDVNGSQHKGVALTNLDANDLVEVEMPGSKAVTVRGDRIVKVERLRDYLK